MTMNILASAASLSNEDLLARLADLAGNERVASVELIAHLAALDARPALYASLGFGSLFDYCTAVLRLSEDAACTRIAVAGACRRFPVILDLLATGATNLTNMRRLAGKLTPENHEAVLARAVNKTRDDIEILLRELDPLPDLRSSIRKASVPKQAGLPSHPAATATSPPAIGLASSDRSSQPPVPAPPDARPVVRPSAPERYHVKFTIGEETHRKLRRIQTLLRREVPDGDPGAIFDRALTLLLENVEKTKLGATSNPKSGRSIRPGTDRPAGRPSRHIPNDVKRVVSKRDGNQCAFVSPDGRRCSQRAYLEFHHVHPYGYGGPATVENISLRCSRHNKYEAELIFGAYGSSHVEEARAWYGQAEVVSAEWAIT